MKHEIIKLSDSGLTDIRQSHCSTRATLIVLGFNDASTLEGHFVSSIREREKRDRRESRGDEREGQGRKRNRNESEETEEIKTFPLYPYPLQDSRPCPAVSQYQLDAPVMYDTQHLRTTRPSPQLVLQ